ncbi:MAG: YybS family protein [Bdellovibrionales bacterium]|nr:YybS family protein [Bdellovibrionales bacterium]
MPTKKTVGLFVFGSLMVTALTSSFVLLAPLAARFLRLQFGRWPYWLFATSSSLALLAFVPQWAFYQAVVLLLVGIFADLEEHKFPLFYTAISSVSLTVLSLLLMLTAWAKYKQTTLIPFLKQHINNSLEMAQKLPNFDMKAVDVQQIILLVPAITSIGLMILVFLSIVFVKPQTKSQRLTEFRVPDHVIWALILSTAGVFLLKTPEYITAQKICLNTLYVVVAGYYFQGLSIVGFFFNKMRINYFLKAGLFFILGVHLFVFIVGLGLSDLWFNYRSRWYKKEVVNRPSEEP